MNAVVIVDIDTGRENSSKVIVQQGSRTGTGQISPIQDLDTVELMALLCEGICMLIHAANSEGEKPDHESLQDCINHLESGFADASYEAKIENV